MKALLQRVSRASVTVEGQVMGSIGAGLVVLVGVAEGDTGKDVHYLAKKTLGLRIFSDSDGKFNLSVSDIGGGLLLISQFTLLADARKGRRPSFTGAAPPDIAEDLFNQFVSEVRRSGLKVETGRFQAHMLVEIHNDGPVTLMLDSRDKPSGFAGTPASSGISSGDSRAARSPDL
ncbi:MAG: D-tyrosyl-tRNA(Tyr) deacylase [Dehalococcoidales bacterium]|nr:D-tyrosyl-tRNA(Tyr) deacylase [Dehalococcoidales bacterium]